MVKRIMLVLSLISIAVGSSPRSFIDVSCRYLRMLNITNGEVHNKLDPMETNGYCETQNNK